MAANSGSSEVTAASHAPSPVPGGIGTLTLQYDHANATGAVTFADAVSATGIMTFARGYSVEFQNGATITNATTFANTGALTLGGGATYTFTGGLTATAPSDVTIEGGSVVVAGAAALTLGDVVLDGDVTFTAGSGLITLGAVSTSGADQNLILEGSGGATIASAELGTTTGTLDRTEIPGGTGAVTGVLTAAKLAL